MLPCTHFLKVESFFLMVFGRLFEASPQKYPMEAMIVVFLNPSVIINWKNKRDFEELEEPISILNYMQDMCLYGCKLLF